LCRLAEAQDDHSGRSEALRLEKAGNEAFVAIML
jgi:hypothetical protein